MVIFETTVYGTYFVVKIGYLIAVLSDGTFTPPLVSAFFSQHLIFKKNKNTSHVKYFQEAMTKLHGAVLYNILGVISLTHYATDSSMKQLQEYGHIFSIIKGIVAICCSITYYYDLFQA